MQKIENRAEKRRDTEANFLSHHINRYTNKTFSLNPDFGKRDLNVFHQSAAELALGQIGESVRKSRFGSPEVFAVQDTFPSPGTAKAAASTRADLVQEGAGSAVVGVGTEGATPIRSPPRRLVALGPSVAESHPVSQGDIQAEALPSRGRIETETDICTSSGRCRRACIRSHPYLHGHTHPEPNIHQRCSTLRGWGSQEHAIHGLAHALSLTKEASTGLWHTA